MVYQGSSHNFYRSRGEDRIAEFLKSKGIRYFYEHPLAVIDDGKTKLWHPDFTLPDYGLIVEYFGINGDKSYDQQARHKMDVYKSAGIEGIFLTEKSFKSCWPEKVLGQIESVLKNRLDRFYNQLRSSK